MKTIQPHGVTFATGAPKSYIQTVQIAEGQADVLSKMPVRGWQAWYIARVCGDERFHRRHGRDWGNTGEKCPNQTRRASYPILSLKLTDRTWKLMGWRTLLAFLGPGISSGGAVIFRECILPETCCWTENWWFAQDFLLPKGHLQGSILVF